MMKFSRNKNQMSLQIEIKPKNLAGVGSKPHTLFMNAKFHAPYSCIVVPDIHCNSTSILIPMHYVVYFIAGQV